MIMVEFVYKTKKENIDELMEKFKLSANSKFASSPSNVGIDMFKTQEDAFIFIKLNIYYNSIEDYNKRTEFERSLDEWNDIWFNENNKHIEESVKVFDVLNRF